MVDGYVAIEAVRDEYGVAIVYEGDPNRIVRTADLYRIDEDTTTRLRATEVATGS